MLIFAEISSSQDGLCLIQVAGNATETLRRQTGRPITTVAYYVAVM